MSEISLRTYLQQIVDMVQDERYEEAILHARHILRYYPKYLPLYRILGEIYLSNRRFPEAADLFQRVLSAMPDDFLAHFGMATIREEEGNLDAAIWHMERAFEAQPTHVAIQEELRRLYRERDGVAPPRIRFTRLALARIYLQSGLFNQSIVELQAVLHRDPKRLDAWVLLAQAYYEAGQWVQAADACARVLKKLPYCLQANRIMAEILRRQGQEEQAQHYWSRVLELDPYEAFVGPEYPSADRVPADKVRVPRLELEYTSDLDAALPAPDEAEMPMLEELEAVARDTGLLDEEDTGPPEDEIFALSEEAAIEESSPYVPSEQAEELIPEWMQESGWVPRDPAVPLDAAAAPPVAGDEDEEEEEAEPLAEGEIPEWLQSLRPTATEETPAAPVEAGEAEAEEVLGLVQDWLPESEADTAILEDLTAWLTGEEKGAAAGPGEGEAQAPAEAEAATLPEWLTREQEAEEEAEPAELPEWLRLQAEGEEGQAEEEGEALLPEAEIEIEAKAVVEETLLEVEADAEAAVETALADAEAQAEEALAEAEVEAEAAAELPTDVLRDDEAALAWLEQLAAKQGAKTEELLTFKQEAESREQEAVEEAAEEEAEALQPEADAEAAVETALADAEAQAEEALAKAEAEVEAEAAAELPTDVLRDDEAALAWLEQLAAKQGAKTEELLTFRKQEAESGEQEALAEAAEEAEALLPEAEIEAEAVVEETLLEVEADAEAAVETALADAEAQAEEALAEAKVEAEAEVEAAAELPTDVLRDDEAALAWLEQLAAKQGAKTEELLTFRKQEAESREQEAVAETAEEEEAEPAELPEWLRLQAETEEGQAEAEAEALLPEAEVEIEAEAVVEETLLEVEAVEADVEAAVETALADAEAQAEEALAEAEAEAEAAAELPTDVLRDDEAALAWLEQLAAKQGAKTEELLTFKQEAESREQEAVEEAPEEEAEPAELPEWLRLQAEGEEGQTEAEVAETALPESDTLEDAIANLAWMEAQAEAQTRERPTTPPDEEEWLIPTAEWEEPAPTAAEAPGAAPAEAEAEAEPVPQETLEWVQEATAEEEGVEITPPAWVPAQQHIPPPETMSLKPLPEEQDPYLDDLRRAREAIANDDLETGLRLYRRLIRRRKYLDEVIEDLLQAQYYYPMSVELLQLLGDAFARAGRLQDALDTYLKAEELLR